MTMVQGKVMSTLNCAAMMRPELGNALVSMSPAGRSQQPSLVRDRIQCWGTQVQVRKQLDSTAARLLPIIQSPTRHADR